MKLKIAILLSTMFFVTANQAESSSYNIKEELTNYDGVHLKQKYKSIQAFTVGYKDDPPDSPQKYEHVDVYKIPRIGCLSVVTFFNDSLSGGGERIIYFKNGAYNYGLYQDFFIIPLRKGRKEVKYVEPPKVDELTQYYSELDFEKYKYKFNKLVQKQCGYRKGV